MPNCRVCGTEIIGEEVFVCTFCENPHCGEHRIPEKHECPFQRSATPPEVQESSNPAWTGARDVLSSRTNSAADSSDPASIDADENLSDRHTRARRPEADDEGTAPTATCDYCGGEVDRIYRCNNCGDDHCRVHKERHQHGCFDNSSPDLNPDGSLQTRETSESDDTDSLLSRLLFWRS